MIVLLLLLFWWWWWLCWRWWWWWCCWRWWWWWWCKILYLSTISLYDPYSVNKLIAFCYALRFMGLTHLYEMCSRKLSSKYNVHIDLSTANPESICTIDEEVSWWRLIMSWHTSIPMNWRMMGTWICRYLSACLCRYMHTTLLLIPTDSQRWIVSCE
jgi:hypothetical protein